MSEVSVGPVKANSPNRRHLHTVRTNSSVRARRCVSSILPREYIDTLHLGRSKNVSAVSPLEDRKRSVSIVSRRDVIRLMLSLSLSLFSIV